MELIETVELDSSQSSITFSNISQDFDDLVVKISARADGVGTGEIMNLVINGGGTSPTHVLLEGFNGVRSATGRFVYIPPSGSVTADTFGSSSIYISNYTSSGDKSISTDSVTENNSTFAAQQIVASLWANSSAITSLEFTLSGDNFVTGTVMSLYGVLAEDNPDYPLSEPKATGGSISLDGGYFYHTFTSSDTFTPTESITGLEYLVVAGGGGGGQNASTEIRGGGGGAGGLLSGTTNVTAQAYTMTVGAGGGVSASGTGSSFGSIASTNGGGRGGQKGSADGASGGSGGGGAYDVPTFGDGGAGTSGQGNTGGDARSPHSGGGGGGGAGAVGQNAGVNGSDTGGDGGDGLDYSAWSSATGTGESGFYAGGGGGGGGQAPLAVGGDGGGGAGGNDGTDTHGVAGQANTGGGGGGAYRTFSPSLWNAAAGGSGIVIVRYAA